MNRNAVLHNKDWSEDEIPAPKRYTLHLFNANDDAFTKQNNISLLPKEEACRDRATD